MNCCVFLLLTRTNFQYVNPLSLKHYVAFKTMSPFIFTHNINKQINKNHDTNPNKNENEDVSVPIHQVLNLNKSEYQKRKRK